jgi:hypothetical protein
MSGVRVGVGAAPLKYAATALGVVLCVGGAGLLLHWRSDHPGEAHPPWASAVIALTLAGYVLTFWGMTSPTKPVK